mmetsp:Transcript_9135/g.25098  ORF Transcript_9135/g.25098 Transcript_9135/m.25098 type:complete len:233 (+) Transcript_9135:1369-2067(+)
MGDSAGMPAPPAKKAGDICPAAGLLSLPGDEASAAAWRADRSPGLWWRPGLSHVALVPLPLRRTLPARPRPAPSPPSESLCSCGDPSKSTSQGRPSIAASWSPLLPPPSSPSSPQSARSPCAAAPSSSAAASSSSLPSGTGATCVASAWPRKLWPWPALPLLRAERTVREPVSSSSSSSDSAVGGTSGQYCAHFSRSFSTRLVSMTTMPDRCSHTMRQKSPTVCGSGPMAAM